MVFLRARQILVQINGVDVSHLKSVKYSDTIKGEADTCEIVLEDADKNFLNGAGNLRGARLEVTLINTENNAAWRLGSFEVDKVQNKFPPSECTLKLNSIPNSAGARGILHFDSWEKTKLSSVAASVAARAGLMLFYDAPENPEVKRIEQSGEPDLAFLKRICKNYALSVKVHDGKLIIFDESLYEKKPPVGTISINDSRLISFSAEGSASDIYSGANVSYKNNNVVDYLFALFGVKDLFKSSFSGGNIGQMLEINERVNSESEAKKLAQSKTRDKNKKEWTANLTLKGDFNFAAGNTLQLENFGIHSGKYIIDRADHNISDSGYISTLGLHKCLAY